MARQYILSDDIDGTQDDTVTTITWAYDGQPYEIDLSSTNRAEFEDAIKLFRNKSRTITRITLTARTTGNEDGTGNTDPKLIREWAGNHPELLPEGESVSERGRISAAVISAYNEFVAKAKASDDDNSDDDKSDSDESKSDDNKNNATKSDAKPTK